MSVVLSDEEVKLYFAEITTGQRTVTIGNGKGEEKEVILRQPTAVERRGGAKEFKQAFEDCIADGIRTRKQLERDFIDRYKFITAEDQERLTRIEAELKIFRKQLLRLPGEPILVKQKKEEIEDKEFEYFSILSNKNRYYTETAEYQAESAEINYYARFCVPEVWRTPKEFQHERDAVLRRNILTQLTSFVRGFDQGTLRALARNPNIRTRWRVSKKTGNPFFGIPMQGGQNFIGSPTAEWSSDQAGLSSWLMYYDDVAEAFEAPEWLMRDDDKLDKWVEKKMKAREMERIKKLGTGSDRSAYDHEEVIVFDDDKDLIFGEGSPYKANYDRKTSGGKISDEKSVLP